MIVNILSTRRFEDRRDRGGLRCAGLPRLDPSALRRLGGGARPSLAERPAVGIVHLGIGAFHRAHQAVYTADAVERAGGDWGILGVAQRRPAAVDALGPQDGLFSVLERGPEEDAVTVISAVRDVLLAPREPDRLSEAIADPGVHVVTLTVTEKAYPRDRATGGLRLDDLEVASDLAGGAPRTAIGQLARGIALRAQRGEAGPLTLVSCDNLPRNGDVLRRLVHDFCARMNGGARTLEWLERNARFPSTMVDRVVPATTPGDREEVARRLGLEDRGGGRRRAVPPVGDRGLLRRSAPGLGAGRRADRARRRPARGGQAAAAQRDPLDARVRRRAGRRAHRRRRVGRPVGAAAGALLGDEDLEPTLPDAPGIDIAAYRAELGQRWINPRIAHRLEQIGADGSQKLPARFAEPARRRLADGAPPRWIALVMAAWARHLRADETGLAVRDPGAEPVQRALAAARGHRDEAAAVLAVLGEEVAGSEPMADLVVDWLGRIDADGIAGALKEAVRG